MTTCTLQPACELLFLSNPLEQDISNSTYNQMALVSHSLTGSRKTNFEFLNFFLQCCNKYFEGWGFGGPSEICGENQGYRKAAGQKAGQRQLSSDHEKLYQDAFRRLILMSPQLSDLACLKTFLIISKISSGSKTFWVIKVIALIIFVAKKWFEV